MGYLRSRDYDKQIQSDNLSQILNNDSGIRLLAEATAEEECISYLIQKYDTDTEFNGVMIWSPTFAYDAAQLIELNYNAYSAIKNYVIDDLVEYSGACYICNTATTGTFDLNSWTLIGYQYDLFYAKYPQELFSITKVYNAGDLVFWKGNIYTCRIASYQKGHNDVLQYGQYSNIPDQNIFPDDPVNGELYWGTPTSYVVSAGTLPTDLLTWIKGDNRSQQLLTYTIDITLYHLHSRIAPRNIPQLRKDRYDMAIEWLQKANTGIVTANIPTIQPRQGRAIRFGGNVKNINTY